MSCGDDETPARGEIVYPPPNVELVELGPAHVLSEEAPSTLAFAIDADERTGRLVVLDFQADQPVVIMSASGEIVARVGARGEGPHEFKDVGSLSTSNGIATVWDRALGRVGDVSIADPGKVTTSRLPVPEGKRVYEVARFRSGDYLLVGQMGEDLAAVARRPLLADDGGSAADYTLELLGTKAVGVPGENDRMKVHFSEASATLNEERDVLALGYQDTGEMVFARPSNGTVIQTTRPGSWPDPTLAEVPGSRVQATSRKSFVGYRAVRQSRDGVWGFFAGNTWDKSHGPIASRDVHAYDWTGTLHAILRLPQRVDDIAVLGDTLYAATNEVVPAIVTWEIPPSVLERLRGANRDLGRSPRD
jgi:hypothetical protein